MKRVLSLMMALACFIFALSSAGLPARAASSKTVTVRLESNGAPVEGASVQFYRVAGLNQHWTEPFVDYDLVLDTESEQAVSSLAETLKSLVTRDSVKSDYLIVTGSDGLASVSDSLSGIYLATAVKYQDNREVYRSQPSLFVVYANEELQIELKPASPVPTVTKRVLKVWDSDEHPDSVMMSLLKDGQVYESVVLSQENNWKYAWADLSDGSDYTVVESVPDGYKALIEIKGDTTIVTNVRIDKEPVENDDISSNDGTGTGKLPQTGAAWYLVYRFVFAGFICLGISILLFRRKAVR